MTSNLQFKVRMLRRSGLGLKDIAKALRLTPERIRKIEVKAKRKPIYV